MNVGTRAEQFLAHWDPNIMMPGDPSPLSFGGLAHPLFNVRGKFISVTGGFHAYVMGIDSTQSESAAFVVELDSAVLSKETLDVD